MFLEVKNISKKYQQQAEKAVSNISFSVNKGEILAIVGESGSGKTSLLHIIGGLLEPDAGSIFLENERVLPPSARLVAGHPHINIGHQNFKMFPLFNVYDNISYFLRHYNTDYQHSRVSELLSLCRLEGIERKFPNELSGGQLQRVALAVALANRPKLLLLDEPFSNLDANLKLYLKKEIANILRESNTTAIVVTHDPQDTFLLADRIAVLHQGKLLQIDKPHIVYQFPINQYVAQLFGEINLLDNVTAELFQLTNCQASIMIRPHDILISNKYNQHAIEGEIKTIDFMGTFYRLEVVLPDASVFVIYTPFIDSRVNEKIYIQLDKQKLLVF